MGARIISKVSHVTCMSECNRRYDSTPLNKLLIGVVFKISGDTLPSGLLRINVHAHLILEVKILSFQKLTSHPAHLLLVLY